MTDNVRDNTSASRFELDTGGHMAVAYYQLKNNIVTFTHTEVPQKLAGQGVGSRLAQGALTQIRARGLRVVPRCPFIAAYIDKHPEWRDLLA